MKKPGMAVATLLALLGAMADWVQKLPCREVTNWSRQGGIWNATHLCYSDPVGLAQRYGIARGALPFRDYPLEYPPGIGYVVALLSRISTTLGGSRSTVVAHYWDLTSLVFGLALLLCLLVVRATVERPLPAMLVVALGPLTITELGLNWDIVAIACALTGIWCWNSGRTGWAGIALGAGAAVKLFPIFLLAAIALGTWRRRELLRAIAWSIGTFVVLAIPAYLFSSSFAGTRRVGASPWETLNSDGVGSFLRSLAPHHGTGLNGSLRFYLFNLRRPADLEAVPRVISALAGQPVLTGGALTVFALAVSGLALGAGTRLRLTSLHPGQDLAARCALVMTAFLLGSKVWSPQYSLWLLPLALIAGAGIRTVLCWEAVELAAFLTRALYFQHVHDPTTGVSYRIYALLLVLRLIAVVVLLGRILRRGPSRHPAEAAWPGPVHTQSLQLRRGQGPSHERSDNDRDNAERLPSLAGTAQPGSR